MVIRANKILTKTRINTDGESLVFVLMIVRIYS